MVIGDNRWFLESSSGEDELYGDFAVPLEMDDEERGEFTEWILYRDGEVVTTVTEDEIDSENDPYAGLSTATLSNPIGSNLKTGASGFVLSTLASMIGLLGTGGEKTSGSSGGDSGTGYRMLGSIFGLKKEPDAEDATWLLWDVSRGRDRSGLSPPASSAQETAPETGGQGPKAGSAQLAAGPETPPAGEDEQWVAARREGTMLLREAAATMKGGALAAAVETCERAIALFEGEVARGVGLAAEEMLLRACCERRSAAEAEEKQADARGEALRLANEAEQWLRNGDLDTALIMAQRAQEALNEVELVHATCLTCVVLRL